MTVDTKDFEVIIQPRRCKACGICVAFCLQQVLSAEEGAIPSATSQDNCSGCNMCEYRCPDLAITVKRKGEAGFGSVYFPAR